jgi:hypothetical protein
VTANGVSLTALIANQDILVCCGSGGVGKTTTAAVLATKAAEAGRRAVVVTIDPARRLADALGLDGLTNDPTEVAGDWPGQMWAMMLDTKSTFDDLVGKYASDDDQRDRILGNRFYRNISGIAAPFEGSKERGKALLALARAAPVAVVHLDVCDHTLGQPALDQRVQRLLFHAPG